VFFGRGSRVTLERAHISMSVQDRAIQQAPEAAKALHYFRHRVAQAYLTPDQRLFGGMSAPEQLAALKRVKLSEADEAAALRAFEEDQARFQQQQQQYMNKEAYSDSGKGPCVCAMSNWLSGMCTAATLSAL
jgi:hypothetical protein